MNEWTLAQMKQEWWLFKQLGIDYPSGVSVPSDRADIIRRAIIDRNLAETVAAKTKGRGAMSWRQVFRMAFHVELTHQSDLWT